MVTLYKRGFTLVELMVVIAIIGILAGIVLTSLSAAKIRGNDAKRKSDLKNLSLALSQYYNDHDSYPSTNGSYVSGGTDYIDGLAPAYTNTTALPQDPAGGGYTYISDGQSYKLFDLVSRRNSNAASMQSSDEFYDPMNRDPGPNEDYKGYAFMVCSGATACTTW